MLRQLTGACLEVLGARRRVHLARCDMDLALSQGCLGALSTCELGETDPILTLTTRLPDDSLVIVLDCGHLRSSLRLLNMMLKHVILCHQVGILSTKLSLRALVKRSLVLWRRLVAVSHVVL